MYARPTMGARQSPPSPPPPARTTDFSSSTQTELAAIVMALEHAYTYHCRNVLIATDSMTAIAAINKQDGENITQTRAIWKTARAIHNAGRSVTLAWIPSHVGISGNEEADALAKRAASDATVATVIPRTLNQLRGAVKAHAERQRQQEQHDQGSESVRWFRQIAAGCPPPARHFPSRLCEVVTCRIRLGYPYPWQLGFATSEEETRCRLCGAPEGHSLEHYLRDCARPSHLRKQCPTPSPTLSELAKHFIAILPQTLREYPKFCAIK
uniref:RNase H type-1 domain-containing protein n=1 Tax=Scylla olivacea TaxID=85551 RepID=A0A0N7Z9R3_SCYOL